MIITHPPPGGVDPFDSTLWGGGTHHEIGGFGDTRYHPHLYIDASLGVCTINIIHLSRKPASELINIRGGVLSEHPLSYHLILYQVFIAFHGIEVLVLRVNLRVNLRTQASSRRKKHVPGAYVRRKSLNKYP